MQKQTQTQTIRTGVFETNSSSTHSICIADAPFNFPDIFNYFPVYKNDQGEDIVHIYTGEYGWGPEQFNDAPTKVSYIATEYCLRMTDPNDESQMHPNLLMTKRLIENYLNVKVIFITDSYSHIDHQSVGTCEADGVFDDEQSLFNYIFNPKSVLNIDSDG